MRDRRARAAPGTAAETRGSDVRRGAHCAISLRGQRVAALCTGVALAAIGERARLLRVHAHHHRHARAQQSFTGDVGRHADAHRQALHDLGEVSGRVVRRQQREHGAGRGREAFDRSLDGVLGQSVDGNGDGLAGPQPRELRFLEVGVDVDRVERHQARQPLAGLHVVAGLHRAVADHAVERRADDGERQIALGLGERGLELVERTDRFLLLALEHVDIGRRRIDRGLGAVARRRPPDRGWPAPARGAGGSKPGARDQHVLPVELELHARGCGLGGNELRLRLLDGGLLGGDLMADPADRCLLGRDLVARRIDREPVVAVVDRGDDIAGADPRIVGDANVAEIARHFRGECRVVGLDVGVVGRNREPADREPVIAVPARAAENGRQQGKGAEAASCRTRAACVRRPASCARLALEPARRARGWGRELEPGRGPAPQALAGPMLPCRLAPVRRLSDPLAANWHRLSARPAGGSPCCRGCETWSRSLCDAPRGSMTERFGQL